jgi:hypothetical protein
LEIFMRAILEGRCQLAHHAITVHCATPDAGTLPEDLLHEQYWANYAQRMRPGDEVVAQPEDGVWYAHYLVRSRERTSARLALLSVHYFDDPIEPETEHLDDSLIVIWRGPTAKWCVEHKPVPPERRGAVVRERLDKKEDAFAYIRNRVTTHRAA